MPPTSAPQQNWPDPRGCSPLKYPLHLFTRRISHLYCPVITKTCYENSSLYSFIKCIGNWGTLTCERSLPKMIWCHFRSPPARGQESFLGMSPLPQHLLCCSKTAYICNLQDSAFLRAGTVSGHCKHSEHPEQPSAHTEMLSELFT